MRDRGREAGIVAGATIAVAARRLWSDDLTQTATDWKALEARYYVQCFNRSPVTIVRGNGTMVWDDEGREYLDFTAGIAVNALGHANEEIADAVADQARTLVHTSNLFYTTPQLELAKILVDNSCLDRIFYVNSGGEATETAVKSARKYGRLHLGGAFEVITTNRGFHGRSLAMTAATGTPAYQEAFQPMPEGFGQVEYNDLGALESAVSTNTCAVMIELVQAEGGVYVADREYVAGVRGLCDERGILLILDEVQTGVGRLGAFYGYERFGIEPDMVALAKGLGGGLPIGAALMKESCAVLRPGDHGSTFSGNPLVCAAATVVARTVLEPAFLDSVQSKGDTLRNALEGLESTGKVVEVRGLGLLLGFQLDAVETADALIAGARDRGLLIIKVSADTVRMVPPLTVSQSEIDAAVGIIQNVLVDL